jgi:hypothetical protein
MCYCIYTYKGKQNTFWVPNTVLITFPRIFFVVVAYITLLLPLANIVRMQAHFIYCVKTAANAFTMVHQPSRTATDLFL